MQNEVPPGCVICGSTINPIRYSDRHEGFIHSECEACEAVRKITKGNQYVFRCWDRDNPYDGRSYLDIWRSGDQGKVVSQTLVPKGSEDAFHELVKAHAALYPESYADPGE